MKVKTSELIGSALDWAVAKAQRRPEIKLFGRTRPTDRGWVEVRFNPERQAVTARFDPSENWEQGGPIIEREKISVWPDEASTEWLAEYRFKLQRDDEYWGGPTPLIAAMRCYCCSKLGDVVDIPGELCQQQSS